MNKLSPGGGETIWSTPMAVRLVADRRPSADGSAVRTSLVVRPAAGSQRAYSLGWDRQTGGQTNGSRYRLSLNAPLRCGIKPTMTFDGEAFR